MVSVGISVPQRGLTFYVYDPRTHREAYRLVSFFDACTLLSDRTLDSIENDLGNMDESVAYDLADEFATLIEITNTGTCFVFAAFVFFLLVCVWYSITQVVCFLLITF